MTTSPKRRRTLVAFLSGCAIGFLAGPGLSDSRPARLEDLFAIRNIESARISPAGDRVAFVLSTLDMDRNLSDSDIWLVPAAGGPPLRLTRGPGRDDTPRWSPRGDRIAFISDRDGHSRLWVIDPDGGEAARLSPFAGGASAPAWSPDGKSIAFLAVSPPGPNDSRAGSDEVIVYDRDLPGTRIFLADVATGDVSAVTDGSLSVVDYSWSPSGNAIVFAAQPSPRIQDLFKTDIFTVDLRTRTVRPLVEREGVDTFPRWSPDGSLVAFLSTDGRTEWIANWYLCLVPAGGGRAKNITPDFDEFMFSPQWSADSRTVHIQSPERMQNQLFAVGADNGTTRPVLAGDWVWSDFSFSDAGRMAFLGTDPSTPTEVFVSGPGPFKPVRLTFSNPQLEAVALGRQEIVRWMSPDGLEVEGLLLLPPGDGASKPFPLLTYVHGGPSGRFSRSFSPQIGSPYPVQAESYPLQVLAGRGYAVLMPNPRGSYGYGSRFRMANIKDWGGGDYRDIMSGIDALVERGLADPSRLGIMGRSYGGYMTGWIITQTDRFRAASLGAGMSDLVSFYGQTDIPGYTEFYLGDVPWKALELYNARSPIVHAANLRTPTLILHGEKDFRVPVPQAEELYAALKRNGVPAQLIIYPRQGHVSAEPKFMRDELERNLEWFTRWIK